MTKQLKLDLEIPEKIRKKNETYYLDKDTIEYIINEAERRGLSKNVLLIAIINFYRTHGQGD